MRKLPSKIQLQEKIEMSLGPEWRIGIVYSSYYPEEVKELIDGAKKTLKAMGIEAGNISLHPAPGAFEVPLIGAALAKEKRVDALIGLGIIVEGETHHAGLIASEVSRGIMDVQIKYDTPFAFEILYVDSLDQAKERLDKGKEAAFASLHSLAQLKVIQS